MGYEVLDGKLTHKQWYENESEDLANSDDSHTLLKWGGGHYEVL